VGLSIGYLKKIAFFAKKAHGLFKREANPRKCVFLLENFFTFSLARAIMGAI
jgi:hypothetical protein